MDMSIKYSNLALKAHMYLYSYAQDKGILAEKATELYTSIETTIVNNELPPAFWKPGSKRKNEMKDSIEKLYRNQYKNIQTSFFESLRKLAVDIKDVEWEKWKAFLTRKTEEINLWIDKKLWKHKFDIETDYKIKYQGL